MVYVLWPSAAVDSVTTIVVWYCFDFGFAERARFFSDALGSAGKACGGGGGWKGLNCVTRSSMLLALGGPSKCLTPLLELSWRTSHRTPASSCDALLLPSRFSIVSCSAMITSSGRFSAEFPFSQTSSWGFDSNMLLKVSSEAGGGIGLARESG